MLEGPAVTALAYPNLHRIAYGEGARLTAEARVEAADALERLEALEEATQSLPITAVRALIRGWRWVDAYCELDVPGDFAAWEAAQKSEPLTPAHDKEKSS